MRKKDILKSVVKIVNSNKQDEKQKDFTVKDVERIIDALKQTVINCITKQEEFNYFGFFEVESTIRDVKGKFNPKTRKELPVFKRCKVNISLAYGIRQLIKKIKT